MSEQLPAPAGSNTSERVKCVNQVGEVHDLHFGPAHGTFFTTREPLELAKRFPPQKGKKKKS